MAPPAVAARAVWRLLRTVAHVLHGLAIVWLTWPGLAPAQRQARVGWWAGKLLRGLGVQSRLEGRFAEGGVLLLANHVSWLDIAAIHAVCPQARFVSKADVLHWPVIGRLTMAADTLFIERERKRDAMRVVHQTAAALSAGDTVAVFPEGTTGDGRRLLPFHANLLQAAISSAMPVQPVVLRYAQPGLPISPAAAWVGETTLLRSLWWVARAEGLCVHVQPLASMDSQLFDRRALALEVREQIAAALAPHQDMA
ncbi:lysophospholipid acyltransferase family protein [Aquabacterium sp.]|uniref:lysophospholipid acyltransferase family protein n=1 Tax=Aquabacterium sp. TaxID=1872578 RepID=UPI003782EDB4